MQEMTLEKVTDIEIEKINESHNSDCRHLKKLLNTYFEGNSELRFYLLKNIEDLENEFCNLKSTESRSKDINEQWKSRYSSLKLSVYKACGYVSGYLK